MKKFFSVLMVLLLSLTLISCKKNNGGGGNGGGGNGGGGGDNPGPIGKPTEIVIMHGAIHEIDPRHPNYSGREQAAKIKLHEEVEKELNVKIKYESYPADAPWGPARQGKIIEWHAAGQAKADIYWIPTIWLGEIVDAGAVVPIDDWLKTHGKNINTDVLDLTLYKGKTWGFMPEPITGEKGLFYNTALIEAAGLEDPVDLWNRGEWTWDRFASYAEEANTKLQSVSPENKVLGSYPSVWAESLIPLNGGAIVDLESESVTFTSTPAIQTYEYLEDLYKKGLFETSPNYDSGSDAYANGNVLFHPGHLWFVRAENRWGQFDFVKQGKIGVVPFPLPAGKSKDDYRIPVGEEAIYTVASNPKDRSKEELAFEVWNRIQLWESEEEFGEAFRDSLIKTFDDSKHVDVYMEIYNKIYFDIHGQLGIGAYSQNAWQIRVNTGIKDGTTRTELNSIIDVYREALNKFLGKDSE